MVKYSTYCTISTRYSRDACIKHYDYMWPILSETGEQELFAAEVYATAESIKHFWF